ncbi:hypothetical protein HJG60_009315 [Phyllostomus discolor]|uniref:Uncharacterized protein n=1 Tax=Phyllostomus discolor TaxID=89673 RepID=A0A833YG87_9CHIR|nr:hypothetical protein HJG60_009315 [Phyllostomus discolor]
MLEPAHKSVCTTIVGGPSPVREQTEGAGEIELSSLGRQKPALGRLEPLTLCSVASRANTQRHGDSQLGNCQAEESKCGVTAGRSHSSAAGGPCRPPTSENCGSGVHAACWSHLKPVRWVIPNTMGQTNGPPGLAPLPGQRPAPRRRPRARADCVCRG